MKNYEVDKNVPKQNGRLSYDLNAIEEEKVLDDKKKKYKKNIRMISILMAIFIPCIIFGCIMYNGYVKTNRAYSEIERNYTELSMSYVSEGEESENADTYLTKVVDFKSLQEQESDIYAWIKLPGTKIDYPILQSGDGKSEDYWLNHNLDGTTGYPGTIFTETMFGKDFKTFNTVIYGHNMKNQTMFGELHNFEESKDYFEEHEYIYIYTDTMSYKYQIVCASTISDTHLAIAYNGYKTEQQRQQFIDYIKGNSVYTRNIETGKYDSYITLSTCTTSDSNRFVVLAKCVDKVSNTNYD